LRIWYKCDGGDNRQSAAKPEKESSTTIPREGSTIQAVGIGSGFA